MNSLSLNLLEQVVYDSSLLSQCISVTRFSCFSELMFIFTVQCSLSSLSMLSWQVLLLSLSTTSARLCTGPQFRPNMSLLAGESVELDCHLPDCPPPSRITWLRSDSPEEVRFPLVSDQPGIFTLHNAMPEESGWYICETDFYQSFVYLNILISTHPAPPPPPPPQPPVLRNFVTTRTPPTPAPVVVPVVSNVEYKVQTSPPSSQFKGK